MNQSLMGTTVSFYAVPDRTDDLAEALKKSGIIARYDERARFWKANVPVVDFANPDVAASLRDFGAMSQAHREWKAHDFNRVRDVAKLVAIGVEKTGVLEEFVGQPLPILETRLPEATSIPLYVPRDMKNGFDRSVEDGGLKVVYDAKASVHTLEASVGELGSPPIMDAVKTFGFDSAMHAMWMTENAQAVTAGAGKTPEAPSKGVDVRAEPRALAQASDPAPLSSDKEMPRWAALAEAAKKDGRKFMASYIRYGMSLSGSDEKRRAAQLAEIAAASPEEIKNVLDRNAERYRELYAREDKVRFEHTVQHDPVWKGKLDRAIEAVGESAGTYKVRGEFSNQPFDEKKRLASLGRENAVGLTVQDRGLMTSLNRGFAAMQEAYFDKTGIDVGGGVLGSRVNGSLVESNVSVDRISGQKTGSVPGVRKANPGAEIEY